MSNDYQARILECAKTSPHLRHVLKAFTFDDGAVDWEKAFPAVAVTMAEDCRAMGDIIARVEDREEAVEVLVEQMAVADPDIAEIVQEYTNDRRVVDYTAVLLELVRILDRQNDALARQLDDAAAEADLTSAYMVGAERGREVVAAIRARLEVVAEHYEARSLAYDAKAAAAGEGETVPAREAWRWRADLAFEVAEALSRVLGGPQNGPQTAGNGPSVDFPGVGDIRGRVSEKSQPAADLGRFTACTENGRATVAGGDGSVAAAEAAGGAEHG